MLLIVSMIVITFLNSIGLVYLAPGPRKIVRTYPEVGLHVSTPPRIRSQFKHVCSSTLDCKINACTAININYLKKIKKNESKNK